IRSIPLNTKFNEGTFKSLKTQTILQSLLLPSYTLPISAQKPKAGANLMQIVNQPYVVGKLRDPQMNLNDRSPTKGHPNSKPAKRPNGRKPIKRPKGIKLQTDAAPHLPLLITAS